MTIRKTVLLLAALALASTGAAAAQTVTAFSTGERERGSVKDCFYEALGQDYVLTVGAYQLCPLTTRVSPRPRTPTYATGMMAFKTGERRVGQVKECYYRALGKDYLLTIGPYELCPLSTTVD
jgi:hypothetical protein